MKVKISNIIADSDHEPVMVILSKQDKENISHMHPDSSKYCSYPDKEEWTENDHKKIRDWMNETDPVPKDPKKSIEKRKGRTETGRIATQEDWYSRLDKPCQSMWTDFGEPRCSKQFACFILNDSFTCPEGRTLKEKNDKMA